jgi:hypothetical protein
MPEGTLRKLLVIAEPARTVSVGTVAKGLIPIRRRAQTGERRSLETTMLTASRDLAGVRIPVKPLPVSREKLRSKSKFHYCAPTKHALRRGCLVESDS